MSPELREHYFKLGHAGRYQCRRTSRTKSSNVDLLKKKVERLYLEGRYLTPREIRNKLEKIHFRQPIIYPCERTVGSWCASLRKDMTAEMRKRYLKLAKIPKVKRCEDSDETDEEGPNARPNANKRKRCRNKDSDETDEERPNARPNAKRKRSRNKSTEIESESLDGKRIGMDGGKGLEVSNYSMYFETSSMIKHFKAQFYCFSSCFILDTHHGLVVSQK